MPEARTLDSRRAVATPEALLAEALVKGVKVLEEGVTETFGFRPGR